MSSEHADVFSIAMTVAEAFESHEIPYALGGALAYGVWGVPRGTLDIDFNTFVEPDDFPKLFDALDAVLDQKLDRASARAQAEANGLIVTSIGGYRLDVFTPSIPFAYEAARTRVSVEWGDKRVWVLSAEAITVFKMLFFRPKDLADVQRVLGVQGETFATAYVRARLVEIVGEDDERVAKWDEISRPA